MIAPLARTRMFRSSAGADGWAPPAQRCPDAFGPSNPALTPRRVDINGLSTGGCYTGTPGARRQSTAGNVAKKDKVVTRDGYSGYSCIARRSIADERGGGRRPRFPKVRTAGPHCSPAVRLRGERPGGQLGTGMVPSRSAQLGEVTVMTPSVAFLFGQVRISAPVSLLEHSGL
jgi:hypothetical protein